MIERETPDVHVKCLNVWREAGSVGVLSSNIMAIGNFKLPQLNNLMNTRATITYNISNTQIKTEDRWSHVNSPFCLSRYQERLIRDRSTALNYLSFSVLRMRSFELSKGFYVMQSVNRSNNVKIFVLIWFLTSFCAFSMQICYKIGSIAQW